MTAELKNKPNGIILAGGKGIRLGKNKGMALLKGRPLIEHVIDNIKPICDKILISSNTNQCEKYGFEVVEDVFSQNGPMAGIHACLKASDNNDNIVVSVDTPFVGNAFFEFILKNKKDGLAAAPWFGSDHYEPLCAYYNKKLVDPMEAFFNKRNFKLPEFFLTIPFTPLSISKEASFYHPMLFHNINTREDLILAEKYLTNPNE